MALSLSQQNRDNSMIWFKKDIVWIVEDIKNYIVGWNKETARNYILWFQKFLVWK